VAALSTKCALGTLGCGKAHGANMTASLKKIFEPRLTEMLRKVRFERTLEPQAICGYHPVGLKATVFVILDPVDRVTEISHG
jgi:cobalamin-dependent methionine synthase I